MFIRGGTIFEFFFFMNFFHALLHSVGIQHKGLATHMGYPAEATNFFFYTYPHQMGI